MKITKQYQVHYSNTILVNVFLHDQFNDVLVTVTAFYKMYVRW